jgi:hypothetical protein
MPDSGYIVVEKGEWLLMQDPDFYCNGILKDGMNAYIYLHVCACAHVYVCVVC